ncbi:type VI secretion system contractile sheath small subunit [Pseudaeromonas sharmana]|uniref:Type VI secretion system contractile sheath small subunit n=1 Tax=Pseudaeromonas sharmana TaxID=328412 RepID=A0ABV8CP33_9GAMM
MPDHENSVAPQERISIRYRSNQGAEEADVELPLHLLVLANLTGQPDPQPLSQRQPMSIDKNSFTAVMQQTGLQLTLEVPDCISALDDATLSCQLTFSSLEDFTPDRIVTQIPALQRLLQLRRALAAMKGPLRNQPAFRQQLFRLLSDPGLRQQLLTELTQTDSD